MSLLATSLTKPSEREIILVPLFSTFAFLASTRHRSQGETNYNTRIHIHNTRNMSKFFFWFQRRVLRIVPSNPIPSSKRSLHSVCHTWYHLRTTRFYRWLTVLQFFEIASFLNIGNLGVPIKLLFEAEGMKVTAEVCDTIVVVIPVPTKMKYYWNDFVLNPYASLFNFLSHFLIFQMKNGEIYRGMLLSAEDTMNMTLSDVLRTARNGQISKLPSVYLRGSSIRFIALPDLLKNAPVFQKVTTMKRKMEKETQQRQEGKQRISSPGYLFKLDLF